MSRPTHPDESANQAFLKFRDSANPDALAEVFDITAARLLRVAHHLCRDDHDAEDLVQEVFLVAIKQRCQYKPQSTVLAWLMGILYRVAHKRRYMEGRGQRILQRM